MLRRASLAGHGASLGGLPPRRGAGLDTVLALVIEDVPPYGAWTNHPG